MKTYEEMASNVLRRMEAYEAEQQAKKARARKGLPAFAAITAAVICLPVGVYAYGLYHQESVQKYIGADGEQLLMESGYSAPRSFSNDKATFTVDTMLYDGYAALAVVTVEAKDPAFTFKHDYGYIPEIVCDAEGNALKQDLQDLEQRTYDGKYLSGYGGFSMWKDTDRPSNQCRYEIRFPNTEEWNGETLYMRFATPDDIEYNLVSRDAGRKLLDGMIVSFDFTQNCECETMTAENGEQVILSDFELIRSGYVEPVPDAEGHIEPTEPEMTYRLIYNDGREETLRAVTGMSNAARNSNIFEFLASDAPYDDENATIIHKVSEIAAIEINGTRYVK